jgi:hypothetical protein
MINSIAMTGPVLFVCAFASLTPSSKTGNHIFLLAVGTTKKCVADYFIQQQSFLPKLKQAAIFYSQFFPKLVIVLEFWLYSFIIFPQAFLFVLDYSLHF